jgi:hypothetical protein
VRDEINVKALRRDDVIWRSSSVLLGGESPVGVPAGVADSWASRAIILLAVLLALILAFVR